ncbi:MAG TPA: RNA methyltransferase [Candidatus Omnitrophota bacterium]|nr:RNA methyltransferase [Candidatus Omnitrophota bacterium]HPS36615.1 RNA methyltransferase [Candidatus Omnitrophota bacterium]
MKPEHISVILVRPENIDNIGAVARAVKNMGFSDLRLVRPPTNWRTQGKKMAMSAGDILQKARVFGSLEETVRDLNLVVGTSRRRGSHRGNFCAFSKTVEKIRRNSKVKKTGLVFGCESKGLANEDIDQCDLLMTIPTGKVYPSLNLAQAVMVVLFSIATAGKEGGEESPQAGSFLNRIAIEAALGHFEQALRVLGYREGGSDLLPRILQTLRGLIKRSGLLPAEAQMIKGLSRRISDKVLTKKRLSCPEDRIE